MSGKMQSEYSFFWTDRKGYALGLPDKKHPYNKQKDAAQACSKHPDCTGYTRYEDGKWYINSGSNIKPNKKTATFVRGGYTTLRYTVTQASMLLFILF